METLHCQSCPLDLKSHVSLQVKKASTLSLQVHITVLVRSVAGAWLLLCTC